MFETVLSHLKGGEIRDTKTLNLSRNIASLQVFVDVSRFSPCAINLLSNKNVCCGLRKVVAKRRARVYFEQQCLLRCRFSSMFPVFHLARSTCWATKIFVAGWGKLLRKKERGSTLSNNVWLCCSFFIKLRTCRATNLLKINQLARRISSIRNKCFCCGSIWSREVKNWKHRRKLATKQCRTTSWGFLYLVFRRLKICLSQYLLFNTQCHCSLSALNHWLQS